MTNIEDLKKFNIHSSVLINYQTNNIENNPSIFGENLVVCSNSVIYRGNLIGENCFIGHNTIIRENNHIGNDVKIGSNVEIAFNVKISDYSKIHSNVFICENTIIGQNTFIGPNVIFLNSKIPNQKNSKKNLSSPKIGKNCIIGGGAILLPDVNVGENSFIGAGTVVTKNVPSNSIIYNINDSLIKKNDKTFRS